jgi:hypothetical protein
MRYSYNNVKGRATRKGIAFTLTLAQFKKFCYRTKYHLKKGRTIDGYNVDRKIEGRDWDAGYHEWNIQCLRKDKNIRKFYDYKTNKAKVAEDLSHKKKVYIERQRQAKQLKRIQQMRA